MRWIVLIAVVCALGAACSSADMDTALSGALGVSAKASAPVFLGCRVVSADEIRFSFSKPVTLVSANFSPNLAAEGTAHGNEVHITPGDGTEAGAVVTADIIVEDEDRNTLNVLTSFRTRNERMPDCVITEIRTEADNGKGKGKGEFVEFKILENGNLGALRMFVATNTMDMPAYEFDPVEVKAGDYVVVHLRTYEAHKAGSVNEYGTNLAAASAPESHVSARDFWIPDATERLRQTDAVFFLNQDDEVIDAVIFSEEGTWGNKTHAGKMARAAELLEERGAWGTSNDAILPADAVSSQHTTATRTICRNESADDTDTAADWYITASSSATPGTKNSVKQYAAKK